MANGENTNTLAVVQRNNQPAFHAVVSTLPYDPRPGERLIAYDDRQLYEWKGEWSVVPADYGAQAVCLQDQQTYIYQIFPYKLDTEYLSVPRSDGFSFDPKQLTVVKDENGENTEYAFCLLKGNNGYIVNLLDTRNNQVQVLSTGTETPQFSGLPLITWEQWNISGSISAGLLVGDFIYFVFEHLDNGVTLEKYDLANETWTDVAQISGQSVVLSHHDKITQGGNLLHNEGKIYFFVHNETLEVDWRLVSVDLDSGNIENLGKTDASAHLFSEIPPENIISSNAENSPVVFSFLDDGIIYVITKNFGEGTGQIHRYELSSGWLDNLEVDRYFGADGQAKSGYADKTLKRVYIDTTEGVVCYDYQNERIYSPHSIARGGHENGLLANGPTHFQNSLYVKDGHIRYVQPSKPHGHDGILQVYNIKRKKAEIEILVRHSPELSFYMESQAFIFCGDSCVIALNDMDNVDFARIDIAHHTSYWTGPQLHQ